MPHLRIGREYYLSTVDSRHLAEDATVNANKAGSVKRSVNSAAAALRQLSNAECPQDAS